MKNLIALLIFILCSCQMASQNVITRNKDKETIYKRELSLFMAPCLSSISNANITQDSYASSRPAITPNFGFNYYIPVGKLIGYSFGLEYNTIKNFTDYKGWFRSTSSKLDNMGYIYYPAVDANYTSLLTMQSIDIPVCLRFQYETFKNLEVFAECGFKLNVVVSYKQTLDGYRNKKGVYPLVGGGNTDYHLRENDPFNGFTNTSYDKVTTELPTSKTGFSFLGQIGLKARTSDKTFLMLSCSYLKGLSDINSKSESQYVNIFGEKSLSNKYSLLQFGMRVGIGFRIE